MASIAEKADEPSLTESYGVFKDDARAVKPGYEPKTINTDGWAATRLALQKLFPGTALILCFLHIYLRGKLKDANIYSRFAERQNLRQFNLVALGM